MIDEDSIAIISTAVLIEELKTRHPLGCIVALHNSPHEARSCKKDWRISFSGCLLNTLKLATIAVWMHKDEFMKGTST
jgi:hypothetical protein